jgi:prepilin-type processing-associated H-X9-DG protein
MKCNWQNRDFAFTRFDLLIVVCVIAALFISFLVWTSNFKVRSLRYACINNIKQCALGALVWIGDNQEQFPMAVSNKLGGTLDWVPEGNAFRHFQVMSNELSTPVVVWCPADPRVHATNFTYFANENISFFVGLDAKPSDRRAWLFGDRNITNGLAAQYTIMNLASGQSAGWDNQLHDRCANVAFGDGHVEQLSNADLRRTLKEAVGWTNRLALPE